jgi:SAM-dependent methyltransferase
MGWLDSPSPTKIKYINKFAVGKTALDIGCGMGWYSCHLADNSFNVCAIDKEQRFSDPRIKLIIEDIQKIELKQKFDLILAFDIIEHIKDESKILQLLSKSCNQRIILSVPNREDNNLSAYNLTYQHFKDKSHIREYTLEEICEKLENHGFKIITANLEGDIMPQVVCEFIRFKFLKILVRKFISLLELLHILKNSDLRSDIFVVVDKI